ncbi:MAG: hypothetical protein HQL71_15810 [Magnetococcales bacterium]|nr:hypothetical protein [Magnetococcales bacterium]
MNNKNRVVIDTLLETAKKNSAIIEQTYTGNKLLCRIKSINLYSATDDIYKIEIHTNQDTKKPDTFSMFFTVFIKGHDNIIDLQNNSLVEVSCDKIACLSRNKTIYIRVNTSYIDSNPHVDTKESIAEYDPSSLTLLQDDVIEKINLTTPAANPPTIPQENENVRFQKLYDDILQTLELEFSSIRQNRLTEIDTLSVQKQKAAENDIETWAEKERNRLKKSLENKRAKLESSLEADIATSRRIKLINAETELIKHKETAVIDIKIWVEQEEARLKEFIDKKRETLESELQEEIIALRKKRIHKVETKATQLKKDAVEKIKNWVADEEARIKNSIDNKRAKLEHAMEEDIALARKSRMLEVETETTHQKNEAINKIEAWSQQEEARLKKSFDDKREILNLELISTQKEKMAGVENDITLHKKTAIAKIETWVEHEKSRLYEQLTNKQIKQNKPEDQTLNPISPKNIAEIDANLETNTKAKADPQDTDIHTTK